jgi:hypothetical protein
MPDWCQWEGEDLILRLRVQPKASKDEVVGPYEDCMKVRITAAPVAGGANEHLVKYLSKIFKVPKSKIRLLSGETAKVKRFRIQNPKELPAFILK